MDQSPLGRLAGELRNRICELVLYEPGGFDFMYTRSGNFKCNYPLVFNSALPHGSGDRSFHLLTLTTVCKDIRAETISLFYGINTFKIETRVHLGNGHWGFGCMKAYESDLKATRRWLQAIGKYNAAQIESLIIVHKPWELLRPETGTNNKWWNAARRTEKKFLHPFVHQSRIYVKTVYECLPRVNIYALTEPNPELCNKLTLGNPRYFATKALVIVLPTDAKSKARDSVGRAFSEKLSMLKSHEGHACVIGDLLSSMLEDVRKSRSSIDRAPQD